MAEIDRVAARIVDRILRESGFVGKSAGSAPVTRASLMPYALTVAAGIADVQDQVRKAVKPYLRGLEAIGERLDRNGERIRELAERYGTGQQVPGVTEIAGRGWRRFDPEDDVVGLVPKQAAPKVNGSSSHGDGVAPVPPPLWHPESE